VLIKYVYAIAEVISLSLSITATDETCPHGLTAAATALAAFLQPAPDVTYPAVLKRTTVSLEADPFRPAFRDRPNAGDQTRLATFRQRRADRRHSTIGVGVGVGVYVVVESGDGTPAAASADTIAPALRRDHCRRRVVATSVRSVVGLLSAVDADTSWTFR